MKGKKYAGGGVKLLTAILFSLFITANALAEKPDALLSKESSKQMFSLSRLAWEENARQVKAAGVGDFKITKTGEFTLIMRPTQGAGLLMVTPSYKASKEKTPWKLSVTIAADQEPALSLYRSMPRDVVKRLIQASARAVAPEYSVMGYMARTTQTSRAPSIHFTIFRAGDFLPIDMLVKRGMVCPPVGGKQVCVRSSMIK